MKNIKNSPTNSYIAGFVLSIILTVIPYYVVTEEKLFGNQLIIALLGYAVIQLFVQLYFFLHIGRESKPRWNLISLVGMACIILIIVVGSLWIMKNLNYHSMTPSETDQYLIQDENLKH